MESSGNRDDASLTGVGPTATPQPGVMVSGWSLFCITLAPKASPQERQLCALERHRVIGSSSMAGPLEQVAIHNSIGA